MADLKLITEAEAAERLRVTRRTIRGYRQRGLLTQYRTRVGNHPLYDAAEVEELLEPVLV